MPLGYLKGLLDSSRRVSGSVVLLGMTTLSGRAEDFSNPWGTASPEGSHPNGGLVVSRGILYGTTAGGAGGFWGYGTVFALKANGKGFNVLHHFSGFSGPRMVTNSVGEISYPTPSNSDGAYPAAGLALSGRTLYGTATEGGSAGMGTIFKVNTDGSGFAVLHHFSGTSPERPFGNSDGARPMARLAIAGNTLYGTAQRGGHNEGTIFKLNTDGSGFLALHTFSPLVQSPHRLTNSDGAFPESGLVVSRSTIYGTAWSGGISGNGTVFKLGTDGSGFQVLHEFGRGVFDANGPIGDEDGSTVEAGLVLSGNVLFGTTHEGGVAANGVVFKINTDGSGFSVLHSFSAHGYSTPDITNYDGANPRELILSGRQVLGLAAYGGGKAAGTAFRLTENGATFDVMHNFDSSAGSCPFGPLASSDNFLYGALHHGAVQNGGSIFRMRADGTDFQVLHNFSAKPLPPSLTD